MDKAFAEEPGCRTSVEQVVDHFQIRYFFLYSENYLLKGWDWYVNDKKIVSNLEQDGANVTPPA